MSNKRGISSIIATLILILLTIVLIGIVWVVVRNIVSSSSQGISLGSLTLDLKIKQAVKGTNNFSVTVQRQPGSGNLVGVNFVISDGTNFETIKQNVTLDIYEGKTFFIFPQQIDLNSAKTVSVAPVYTSENGGASQTGKITDTYTFGTGSAAQNQNSNSCTPAINQASLCTGYTCGSVNNGTCSPISCGSCSGQQICNLVTHQCEAGGGASCNPDPNPTFAGLCTIKGYTCGEVNNGTCSTVNCGSCTGSQFCDLSSSSPTFHQCVTSANSTCVPKTCQQSNYQCGAPLNGCGASLDCGTCNGANSFCDAQWQCQTYQMVNSGTLFSGWPQGAVYYFDSLNLPTSGTEIVYYNDGAHYVRFPGSGELTCIRLSFILFTPENGRSYAKLYFVANVTAGNNYQIWNNQQGCQLHQGYS